MELEITTQILLIGFAIAAVMGAIVNKTNFCTMGAVSDWVNMGDTGRLRAWIFAIALALTGVLVFEALGMLSVESSLPPYRSANFAWARYVLGGLLFGIGMTLGSGCGNKTMVRVGGGNLKSLVVLVTMAIFAYIMTKTDFYGVVFHSWINPISIDLSAHGIASQELGQLVAAAIGIEDARNVHLVLGGAVAAALFLFAFGSADFRSRFDNLLGGAGVGLAVIGAWYLTAGPLGRKWVDAAMFMDNPPVGVGAQSYTFVNPTGETLTWLMSPGSTRLVTFGVVALAGVIAGSFVYAVVTRKFRIEWFSTLGDFTNHVVGGTLMGIGGVLAMGCTIGQGVTGISTLALGSILAFVAIVFGAALTMKVQYYKLVYEKEASFAAAVLTALVDMHLLPKGLRRLQAV